MTILPTKNVTSTKASPSLPQTTHLALVRLVLPQLQVDLREAAARDALVEELVVLVEGGLLDLVDHVRVLADDLGEGRLPDLRQLRLGEPHRGVRGLVPEPEQFNKFDIDVI